MAKKTLADLARRMEKAANSIEKQASAISVGVAETVVRSLVSPPPFGTPVDTSNAISNWQVGIGRPVSSDIQPYFEGQDGSTRGASANAAIAVAKSNLKRKKPGQSIFISNLADYIVDLDEGSSRQAPAGITDRAIMNGRAYLKKQKVRI